MSIIEDFLESFTSYQEWVIAQILTETRKLNFKISPYRKQLGQVPLTLERWCELYLVFGHV